MASNSGCIASAERRGFGSLSILFTKFIVKEGTVNPLIYTLQRLHNFSVKGMQPSTQD
jgi:hypothetical protein